MTVASQNEFSQQSSLTSYTRRRLDDDESWRKPGMSFRANLVRLDTRKNSFHIKTDCSIERYYQVADRVLETFLHHSIDTRSELIEAYLIGSRLVHFLSTVLPTHPEYFVDRPDLAQLRDHSQAQLVELGGYIDVMAVMLDRQEHERYISYVLERGGGEEEASQSVDPTAETEEASYRFQRNQLAMTELISAQNQELQDWSLSLEAKRPLLHDDWDSAWIKQHSRMHAMLDQYVSDDEGDSKLEESQQSEFTVEEPILAPAYFPLADSPPRWPHQHFQQQERHLDADSNYSPPRQDDHAFVEQDSRSNETDHSTPLVAKKTANHSTEGKRQDNSEKENAENEKLWRHLEVRRDSFCLDNKSSSSLQSTSNEPPSNCLKPAAHMFNTTDSRNNSHTPAKLPRKPTPVSGPKSEKKTPTENPARGRFAPHPSSNSSQYQNSPPETSSSMDAPHHQQRSPFPVTHPRHSVALYPDLEHAPSVPAVAAVSYRDRTQPDKHQDVLSDPKLQFFEDDPDDPSQSMTSKDDDTSLYDQVYYQLSSPVNKDYRQQLSLPVTCAGIQQLKASPREATITSIDSPHQTERQGKTRDPVVFENCHNNFHRQRLDIEKKALLPEVKREERERLSNHYEGGGERTSTSNFSSSHKLKNGLTDNAASPNHHFDLQEESCESLLSVEHQHHGIASDNLKYEGERQSKFHRIPVWGQVGESVRNSPQPSDTTEESFRRDDHKPFPPRNQSRFYESTSTKEITQEQPAAPKSILRSSRRLEPNEDIKRAASALESHNSTEDGKKFSYDEQEPRFLVNITVNGNECASVRSAEVVKDEEKVVPIMRPSSAVQASIERLKAIRARRVVCREPSLQEFDVETESRSGDGHENQLENGQVSHRDCSTTIVDQPNSLRPMNRPKVVANATRLDETGSFTSVIHDHDTISYSDKDIYGPSISSSVDDESKIEITSYSERDVYGPSISSNRDNESKIEAISYSDRDVYGLSISSSVDDENKVGAISYSDSDIYGPSISSSVDNENKVGASSYSDRDIYGPSIASSVDNESNTSALSQIVERDTVLKGEDKQIVLRESKVQTTSLRSKGLLKEKRACENAENRTSNDKFAFDPFSEFDESEPCAISPTGKFSDVSLQTNPQAQIHTSSSSLPASKNRSQHTRHQKYRDKGNLRSYSNLRKNESSVGRRGPGPIDLDEVVEDFDDIGLAPVASLNIRSLDSNKGNDTFPSKTLIEQRLEAAARAGSHSSPTSLLEHPQNSNFEKSLSVSQEGVFGDEDDDLEMVNAFLVPKRRPLSHFRGCVRFLLE